MNDHRTPITEIETRCIATASDANYFPGVIALLRSLKKTNPSIPVVVFDGGLTGFQKLKVRQYAEIREVEMPLNIEGRGKFSYIGDTTLLKLCVPSLVFDKVLYLDADMIVLEDISRLFDFPDGFVGVVQEVNTVKNMFRQQHRQQVVRSLDIEWDRKGFNAGLFALRPSEWRGLASEAKDLVREFGGSVFSKTKDQQILNILFSGRIHLFHSRYNFSPLYDDLDDHKPGIVHYLSECKPWHPGYEDDFFYDIYRDNMRVTDYAFLAVLDVIRWWRSRVSSRIDPARKSIIDNRK